MGRFSGYILISDNINLINNIEINSKINLNIAHKNIKKTYLNSNNIIALIEQLKKEEHLEFECKINFSIDPFILNNSINCSDYSNFSVIVNKIDNYFMFNIYAISKYQTYLFEHSDAITNLIIELLNQTKSLCGIYDDDCNEQYNIFYKKGKILTYKDRDFFIDIPRTYEDLIKIINL